MQRSSAGSGSVGRDKCADLQRAMWRDERGGAIGGRVSAACRWRTRRSCLCIVKWFPGMERVEIDDRRHARWCREDINRLPEVNDDGGMGGRGYLSNQKGGLTWDKRALLLAGIEVTVAARDRTKE